MGLLYGRAGRLNTKKRRFPARAVCVNRAMALDPKTKDEHCAGRACTDETCCAGVCKPGARCLLAPPAEVKLTTSAKLKTVGKAASRDDILAGLATQLGSDAAKCEGADFGGTELECLDTVGTCEVGDSVDGSITTRAACDTAGLHRHGDVRPRGQRGGGRGGQDHGRDPDGGRRLHLRRRRQASVTFSARWPLCAFLDGELYEGLYALKP